MFSNPSSNKKLANIQDRFIHQLTHAEILTILSEGAWQTYSQSITSAETNNDDNVIPDQVKIDSGETASGVEAFTDIQFDDGVKTILDVGGGKYNTCIDFMKKRNVELLVWDPYNRSHEHNKQTIAQVEKSKVLAATSMSILNVIPEIEVRLAHITTLKHALMLNGKAYFKIWPGGGVHKNSYRPTVKTNESSGYQANAGPDRFLREVQLVFGLDNVEIHPSIPNLIIAINQSLVLTTRDEIDKIQKLSIHDKWQYEYQPPRYRK